MSTTTTHIKTEKQLVPELRFKDFEGEWNTSKLGAVTRYVKGFAFKSDDYQDNGVRIVRVSDLAADRIKTDNDKLYIDEQKALDFDKYKLRTGNIVITTVGSKPEMIESAVGRGIYIHNDNEGLLNQNMLKFENIEGVSNGFIIGLINSRRYQHYMKGIARGNANQANITVVDLLQYNISYPQLPEQQKIASFLSTLDEKIQQLTKKKALLDRYKKGVMQQLFSGQLRFKDENGNPYPDWEEKRLGEIATKESSNISANTIEENFGEFKIYGASGLLKKIDFFREEKPFVSIVKDGAGVGRTLLCEANSSVLGTLDIIKPKSKVILYFLYALLNNIRFEKYMVGSTIPHIYYKDYSSERITIPCLEEQQKIASYLSSIDTKIESVKIQITQTQTFKKGLLQQMFV